MDTETWHIIPSNDAEPHEESEHCHCTPTVQHYKYGTVVTHNAFDGREIFELNNEQLN